MITLKDLARELGVSTHTVSDVLGGDERYSATTRKRVMETADRLGYRPNRQARILRGAKSGLIGMLKSSSVLQAPLERSLFAGEAIHRAGYELMAYDVYWHYDGLARAVDSLIELRVEGVIVAAMTTDVFSEAPLQRLLKSGIPLVMMGGHRTPEHPYVSADFQQGGALQAKHALDLGCRHPVILLRKEETAHASVKKRVEAAQTVFREAGVKAEIVEGKHEAATDDFPARPVLASYQPGYEAMSRLIRSRKLPDAVICINDYLAIAAMQACHDHGVRVPGDVAFIGFDNSTAGEYATPRLTTIHQPVREVARRTVDILVEAIRNRNSARKNIANIELECRLIIRESCGKNRKKACSLPATKD